MLLVTGGCGFIGSCFVRRRRIERPDEPILVLDALTYAASKEAMEAEGGRVTLVQGDIREEWFVRALFRSNRVDEVVHFAAETHVDRSISGPGIFVETNTWGTQILLDAALRSGVKKFVQVSTDEVYGSLDELAYPSTEASPSLPNSPYAASKASADLLARSYYRTFGLPVVVTRSANNFGPWQYPEKLIPLAISRALRGEKIPVYGDGWNVREWVHVEDHCRAIERALEAGRPGEIYNVGGRSQTNLQIIRAILLALDRPESLIEHVADRPGHDRRYAVNDLKIRAELGWRPEREFDEALAETVAWYEERFQK